MTETYKKLRRKKTKYPKKNKASKNTPFYYCESHSKFDGEKFVEERKEKTIDSEGKVHQTLKRRLGNQWYQTEQIKDKERKETIKEAWHNVPEEEIDNFKQEWIKHLGYQNKEIENEKAENKKKSSEKEEVQQNKIKKLTNKC